MVPDNPADSDKPDLPPPLLQPPTGPAIAPAASSLASSVAAQPDPRRLWTAIGVIAVLIIFVVFALPGWVAPPSTTTNNSALSTANSASESDGTTATDINRAVEEYLRLVAALTLINADHWDDPRWQQADESANKANRLFGERRFVTAATHYTAAINTLKALKADRETLLNTAVNIGQNALADNDVTTALAQFGRALAIDADNAAAQIGQSRATVRNKVLSLMTKGQQAERQADLSTAQGAYRAALALDKDYLMATKRLQFVSTELMQRRFRQLMSSALTALDNNRFPVARQALTAAARLKPGNRALLDAQKRLTLLSQQNSLDSLRAKVVTLVTQEDWATAITIYKKALEIEANAAFAMTGLVHAQQQLALHNKFDRYLKTPTRLYSPEPLANAQQLVSAATAANIAQQPKLRAKRILLQENITLALTPIPLTLRSDANTDVVIYHVGRFGRFTQRELNLKPGTYTVVGVRTGYRDARKSIVLLPGQTAPVVDIRCKEKI